jgi:hypothetical protein
MATSVQPPHFGLFCRVAVNCLLNMFTWAALRLRRWSLAPHKDFEVNERSLTALDARARERAGQSSLTRT